MQGNVFYFDWEVALMAWLQAHMGGVGQALATFFTMFGEELVMIVIVGFVYWCLDKDRARQMIAAVGAGIIWNPMIKNIAMRRRPYFDCEDVRCLKPVDASADIMDIGAQGYSFPSGHSTQSMSLFVMMGKVFKNRWVRVMAVALPLLVGVSRFCLGVHFPTDVACGWALGLVCVAAVSWLWGRVGEEKTYLILLLTGVPGLFYCNTSDFFTGYGLMLGGALGFLFEKRCVHFASTRDILQIILRMVGGGLIYVALNALLKLPFSAAWLSAGSTGALLVRMARYTIIAFVAFGVYPMSFKWMARIGQKKEEIAA